MPLIPQSEPCTAQYFTEELEKGIGLDMVQILGGTFWMGSPEGELERRDNEGPQHPVNVPDFFMGKYPVTQAQWEIVASWEKIDQDLTLNPSDFKGPDKPVENISWLDAIEFCQRLSKKTGQAYSLPSEAQWEYACRAHTTTPFYFGETITPGLANYSWDYTYGDYGVEKKEDSKGTTPVGQFPPNRFGLYDMHGNVWEWCLDDWHGDYTGAPEDGSAWMNKKPEMQSSKVLRGGSWFDLPRWCRSAPRYDLVSDVADDFIGFRLVCSSPGLS
jgi:formylglycine-generating enzyme required for sulfatase activity